MYTFKQLKTLEDLAKAAKRSLDNPYAVNAMSRNYEWWQRTCHLANICGLPQPSELEADGIEYGWQWYGQQTGQLASE